MTRLEKCELAKKKGFTYNSETGEIFGVRKLIVNTKNKGGYIKMCFVENYKKIELLAHHYAYFYENQNVNFEMLDHINRDRTDNRICNLRIADHSLNNKNTNIDNLKGYYWNNKRNKWVSRIIVDKKQKYIGSFNTENEAKESYLNAKKKYHNTECLK